MLTDEPSWALAFLSDPEVCSCIARGYSRRVGPRRIRNVSLQRRRRRGARPGYNEPVPHRHPRFYSSGLRSAYELPLSRLRDQSRKPIYADQRVRRRGCEITVLERSGHSEARRGLPEMQNPTICEYPPIRSSVGALGSIAASAVLRWVVSGLHAHEGHIGCCLGSWRSMVRLGNH